jgi:rod shape-determining protein MreC
MPPALDIRRRTLYLFVLVSFGHVLLISAQVQSKAGTPMVEAAAFSVFARVQGLTASVAGAGRAFWSHYVFLHGAAADNEQKQRRIVQLEGELQQWRAIASRINALEDALVLKHSVAAPTIAARVIAGDASPQALTITLDRGSADGIQSDMPVIGSKGVVGRVIGHPAPHASHVQLLIGRNASAGALLERTGKACVVEGGAGDPPLRLDFVETLVDVRPGDRVVTWGHDGIFPPGFLIGTVERAQRGSGVYKEIAVRPAVDFSNLDVVLIVLAAPVKPEGGL